MKKRMLLMDTTGIQAITGSFSGPKNIHCTYGMFNRHGGISEGLFASLNIGLAVGDTDSAPFTNRQRVKSFMKIPRLLTARQIHGSGIYCLPEPLTEDLEVDGFDALVTDKAGIGLMIQHADCQAVLLFDPVRQVIAAVHCGWRGTVQNIVGQVIAVMTESYGTNPADLQAIISPSLGPCCAEFVNYRRELPAELLPFMVEENYFDFWQISSTQLRGAGMVEARIDCASICTCCSGDYFSYRRASRNSHGITGRNCSVIALHKASA